MNNDIIVAKLIRIYGLENTIKFCDMTSYMYDILYKNNKDRIDNNEFAYDYESNWWKNKFNELTDLKNESRTI